MSPIIIEKREKRKKQSPIIFFVVVANEFKISLANRIFILFANVNRGTTVASLQ